ncbi:hypothetical protein [Actinomadura sp. DC4]|uniref:hypothetical protein n=1 Tax=Actinomadura sp. DC4 TaxID=3055069 RepID=UPI0025AF9004|nr:hypothetical protein [Actinomadura sp. DC4]MDN3356774.1 hypothetical protein [Actinomadura sp. DC4]
MAKRTRRWVWWTGIAAVGALALYAGTWRMWALTVLTWSMYELCFCPTVCSVTAGEGRACHKDARGRLYACRAVPGHQQIKTEALWRLTGNPFARLRPTYGDGGGSPAHRRAPAPSGEHGSVEPNQRLMAYLAALALVVVVVQTVVGFAMT